MPGLRSSTQNNPPPLLSTPPPPEPSSDHHPADELFTQMLQMVRVESERQYEELWREYNKEILLEPFLPSHTVIAEETFFAMSPEFTLVVREKLCDLADHPHGVTGEEEEEG